MKDLTKILKTGDKVYCVITGDYRVVNIIDDDESLYPIELEERSSFQIFTRITPYGRLYSNYPNGDCVIFPSKEERSWDNYPKFKKGDLVLMWDEGSLSRRPTIYFEENPGGGHFAASYIDGILYASQSFDNCERFTPEMLEKAIGKTS